MLHAAILLAATLLLATKSATVAFLTPTSHLTLHLKRPTQLYQSITLEVPTAKQKESATAQTSGSLVSGVNLVKNCVGAGIFSLNARVSRISTDPLMLVGVAALVIVMALWASYNFYIVGESCQLTNSETFGELWTKTVSLDSAWIVQTIVTVAPVISCLANTIVLTDVLRVVLRSAGAPLWFYQKRVAVIATLCSFILYPICTVKDLSSLKSVSAFGLLGQLAAMSAFAVRIADKSYQAGGKYFAAASTVAPVATRGITSQWFILASIMSYCYVAHYNAPKYYTELSVKNDKTTDNGGTGGISKSRRFYRMATLSYLTCALAYWSTIYLASTLFGARSASFALNSFHPDDPMSLISLCAFGASVLASYPLLFISIRNFFSSQLTKSSSRAVAKLADIKSITGLLLLGIGGMTCFFTDIGTVGSLSGAIFGSSMIFILPPIIYIRTLVKRIRGGDVSVIGSELEENLSDVRSIGSIGMMNSTSIDSSSITEDVSVANCTVGESVTVPQPLSRSTRFKYQVNIVFNALLLAGGVSFAGIGSFHTIRTLFA